LGGGGTLNISRPIDIKIVCVLCLIAPFQCCL